MKKPGVRYGTDRRTIKKSGTAWEGWHNSKKLGILDLFDKAPTKETQKYLTTYFLTGCRLTEGLMLKPEMFDLDDPRWIRVSDVTVLKHWDFVKDADDNKIRNKNVWRKRKFETTPREVVRNFRIPRKNNPLIKPLEDFVRACDTTYLLPKHDQFTGEINPDYHAGAKSVYSKIVSIDDRIWPHWLRSQCASWLVNVMNLDAYRIKDYFEWSSLEMSANYVKQSDSEWEKSYGLAHSKDAPVSDS